MIKKKNHLSRGCIKKCLNSEDSPRQMVWCELLIHREFSESVFLCLHWAKLSKWAYTNHSLGMHTVSWDSAPVSLYSFWQEGSEWKWDYFIYCLLSFRHTGIQEVVLRYRRVRFKVQELSLQNTDCLIGKRLPWMQFQIWHQKIKLWLKWLLAICLIIQLCQTKSVQTLSKF